MFNLVSPTKGADVLQSICPVQVVNLMRNTQSFVHKQACQSYVMVFLLVDQFLKHKLTNLKLHQTIQMDEWIVSKQCFETMFRNIVYARVSGENKSVGMETAKDWVNNLRL